MTDALTLRGVVKHYRRFTALNGLDLRVARGSIFGLVGSNGAGKTTAMAVTLGILHAEEGQIDILGRGPFDPVNHSGRVALLPQDARFPPHGRVDELLTFYGRLQGLQGKALSQSVDDVVNWVHLDDRRHAAVRTLSHGMNRRLAIAQAFLGNPELVLLDEPLNGLDPRESARVREMICTRRGHQAIVVSSHNLSDIEAMCDTVAFIEHGRCVRQDKLDNIIHRGYQITYILASSIVPLDKLAQAVPEAIFEPGAAGNRLKMSSPGTQPIEQVNAKILRVLLDANVGIMEIHQGSDLENEYFKVSSWNGKN